MVEIEYRIISLATGKICFVSGTVREFILEQANQSEIVEIHARYDIAFLTFREFYYQTIIAIKEHIEEFFPPDYLIVAKALFYLVSQRKTINGIIRNSINRRKQYK